MRPRPFHPLVRPSAQVAVFDGYKRVGQVGFDFSGRGRGLRVLRNAPKWHLPLAVERELGVPLRRQRLWAVQRRENDTYRPMEVVSCDKDLTTELVVPDHVSRCPPLSPPDSAVQDMKLLARGVCAQRRDP